MLNLWRLLFCIFIVFFAAAVASYFIVGAIEPWYSHLNKPSFTPPNWAFQVAWAVLYLLIAVSLYLVLESGKENRAAVHVFTLQLILNYTWTLIFFGLHLPFYALACIVILWLAIAWTIFKFYKISHAAAYLLIPYMVWISFAGVLNYYVMVLN